MNFIWFRSMRIIPLLLLVLNGAHSYGGRAESFWMIEPARQVARALAHMHLYDQAVVLPENRNETYRTLKAEVTRIQTYVRKSPVFSKSDRNAFQRFIMRQAMEVAINAMPNGASVSRRLLAGFMVIKMLDDLNRMQKIFKPKKRVSFAGDDD